MKKEFRWLANINKSVSKLLSIRFFVTSKEQAFFLNFRHWPITFDILALSPPAPIPLLPFSFIWGAYH